MFWSDSTEYYYHNLLIRNAGSGWEKKWVLIFYTKKTFEFFIRLLGSLYPTHISLKKIMPMGHLKMLSMKRTSHGWIYKNNVHRTSLTHSPSHKHYPLPLSQRTNYYSINNTIISMLKLLAKKYAISVGKQLKVTWCLKIMVQAQLIYSHDN